MFRRTVATVLAACCLPLVATAANSAPTAPSTPSASSTVPVVWSGTTWLAKNSPVLKAGPAPNYWLGTPDNVEVDAKGNLHLVTQKILGRWYCAAITSTKSDYGYGTYRFVMSTPLQNFDPNAVVGMFTYNSAPANGHQEIDVELSRWGVPSPTAPNAQYVVQPWRRSKDHIRHFLAPVASGMTYEFTWAPNGVTFKLYNGTTPDAPVIRTWRTKAVPGEPTDGIHVNLNMWLMQAHPPYNGTKQEAVFQSFTYTPAAS
jgi:hypothetical protein